VVLDWGSVLGLDSARQHQDNVRGVVFMEAIIPPSFPMADLTPLGGEEGFIGTFRNPDLGKELLMQQNVFVEQILGNGALTRRLSEEERNVYREPFKTPESRFPIYVWPNELPIAGQPARNVVVINAIGEWLRSSNTPKLLQYASPGVIVPPAAAAWMAENYRNIETQFVGYGAHYIQEDNPEAIGRGIVDWYRRNFSSEVPGADYSPVSTGTRELSAGALVIKVLLEEMNLGGAEMEIAEIVFPADYAGSGHRHGATEVFYVLEGTMDHVVNGEAHRLQPGMVGVVRPSDTVTHRVVGNEPLRTLVVWVPGGEVARLRTVFPDERLLLE
ncbi:MAG: cupin domain-containing protein, partial [Pseudomonadales bacterium]